MTKIVTPYKTSIDQGNAYWMAKLSLLVYNKTSDTNETPDEDGIKATLQDEDADFIDVKAFNNNSAQAMLIEHKNYYCMSFRGTDEPDDWLDNINLSPEKVLFGEFHRGFWDSVEDIWNKIYPLYEKRCIKNKRALFLTGHSLGGAMASIAASRFIHRDKPFSAVYTFGQPRAMSPETARVFNSEARQRYFRFQNNEDIVTRVPTRSMNYSHVGQCLYIDADSKIHSDPGRWFRFLDVFDTALESIKEKGSVGAIDDHDMKKYLALVEQWNTDF